VYAQIRRAAALVLLTGLPAPAMTATIDPDYAESVAMTAHADDGTTTFDVRLARFPDKASGTLWFYAFVDGQQYAVVEEDLAISRTQPIDVSADDAVFEVSGAATASLSGSNRHSSAMTGRVQARGLLHTLAHPDPGSGTIPVEIDANFEADHRPFAVRAGRLEVMGNVRGVIRIEDRSYPLDLPGKWHEQTGVRPRFAPAFTYLFVQGSDRALMATRHATGAWGYVYRAGELVAVRGLEIDERGPERRHFTATLEDGTRVTATATVVREVSVPIEGQRRPGATVLVTGDLGSMVGVLNDWRPTASD